MAKKTFGEKLNSYIKFFENYITKNSNSSDNFNYTINYACTVLNTLKNSYLKEHPNEYEYTFLKNIDVMKYDLKTTNFVNLEECVQEIMDDLLFLKKRYVR